VFWGKSPAMAELRHAIDILARSPLPVLVEGETGTGKSFLAEHVIHPRSGAKGPLVVTDLSTIPSSLLPAHLFGTRRGAYTGAVEDHAGVSNKPTAARCSSTRSPTWIWSCSASSALCSNAARSRAWATASRGPQRPSWWQPPTRIWPGWCARDGFATISTCAWIRPRGCACRPCASGAEDVPELTRFVLLEP